MQRAEVAAQRRGQVAILKTSMPRWPLLPLQTAVVVPVLMASFLAGALYQYRWAPFGQGNAVLSVSQPEASLHGVLNDSGRVGRWQEDLQVFASELPRWHANAFHRLSRSEFQRLVRELGRRLPQLTDAQVTVGIMSILSSIGDGHTGTSTWLERFHRYPIRVTWIGNDLRVTEVTRGAERAKGAKLVRIGQTDISDAYRRVASLASRETELDSRNESEYLFPRAEVLEALGLLSSEKQGRFTFQDDAGVTFTLDLKPISADASSEATWSSVTPHPALFEQRADEPYWFTSLQDGQVVYLKYNSCEDIERFKRFSKGVFSRIDKTKTRRVIVDVRDNGGGDTRVVQPLLDGLDQRRYGRRPGSLVVLTNRGTYSSAMWAANDLKNLGGMLIGEASSQLVQFYGLRKEFTLPHSGLVISYAAEFFPLRDQQGLLTPDVPVTRSFKDVVTGNDPVLQTALKLRSQE